MNPITLARIDAGFSKTALAKKLRLSKTFIIRSEQACYSNPGSKLIEFSTNQLMIGRITFFKQYNSFQEEVRKKSAQDVQPLQVVNRIVALDQSTGPVGYVKTHEVFKQWREDYWRSIVGFSVAMCVHPQSVESYERGLYDQMPVLIQDALRSVNLIDDSFNPGLKEHNVWL